MSLRDQTYLRVVLYEGNDAEPLDGDQRFQVVSRLLGQGFALTRVGGAGQTAPADDVPAVVLGRFRAGVESLTAAASTDRVQFTPVTGLSDDQIVGAVEATRTAKKAVQQGGWKPWFPVIDYDRCTNCMQCLSFCLFGVYGADHEGHIQVQNQDNCKTNCPACSRVCPEAAIMFPKYKAGPINGDAVKDSDLEREKMKVDISALLGGDIYSMLRMRSERAQSRFSKERDSGKALTERQKCLTKLAQAGDIPPEVLLSLPSPEEIQRRAEEAKAKAQAALAVQR
ncbi:ferredoxin family protein [Horticoccus sp. 23ND18S-11]|uniref:ferredoxin family protein n=1 Tax=Horticoccus sp. 23ND18S-11 TaxID=3391832 RepID=UPI0039C9A6F1